MKISVLVPSFNVSKYIPAMVESIVNQSHEAWELILLDDGCTDNTSQVFESMMEEYPAYDLSYHKIEHIGCAGALKKAIELSSGDICTFVGSDDVLKVNALKRIHDCFTGDPRLGFMWTKWEHTGGRVCWSHPVPTGKTLKEALLSGWWGAQCQQAWKRKIYFNTRGFDPSLTLAADLQLACLLAETGCKTYHLPEANYIYRCHDKQVSKSRIAEQSRCAKIIRDRLKSGWFRVD